MCARAAAPTSPPDPEKPENPNLESTVNPKTSCSPPRQHVECAPPPPETARTCSKSKQASILACLLGSNFVCSINVGSMRQLGTKARSYSGQTSRGSREQGGRPSSSASSQAHARGAFHGWLLHCMSKSFNPCCGRVYPSVFGWAPPDKKGTTACGPFLLAPLFASTSEPTHIHG